MDFDGALGYIIPESHHSIQAEVKNLILEYLESLPEDEFALGYAIIDRFIIFLTFKNFKW